MLKPIDIAVLSVLLVESEPDLTQTQLAEKLGVSQSNVHRALRQLERSGLIRDRKPLRTAAFELLVHAIKYVYPAHLGAPTRGIPTAHAVLPGILAAQPYVWPSENGAGYGPALEPLHPSVLRAAQSDPRLYKLLALVDVFRVGRVRERALAEPALRDLISEEV